MIILIFIIISFKVINGHRFKLFRMIVKLKNLQLKYYKIIQ